jgi:hypothetical protein
MMLRSEIRYKDLCRFGNFYWKGKSDECWNWIGGTTSKGGYGYFRLNKKYEYAHRIAYILEYGDFNQNLDVCHTCDNLPCVNPFHLFLGTRKDNIQDMINKGRSKNAGIKGQTHPNAKISDEEVDKIKELYKSGNYSQRQL